MGLHSAKIARIIKKHDNLILSGNLLAIDPASRTIGYAFYAKGLLTERGVLQANDRDSIQERLLDLAAKLIVLQTRLGKVDVLVVEEIRGKMAHAYLMWAVGCILTAVPALVMFEMPISLWKSQTPDGYIKEDSADAQMFGDTVLKIANAPDGKITAVRAPRKRPPAKPKPKKVVSSDKRFGRKPATRRKKRKQRARARNRR